MKKYSESLRLEVMKEYRKGRTAADLAADYEPCYQTIANWVKAADGDAPRDESVDAELKRLRKENRELREDKAILEKAAAWFAKRH